MTTHDAAQQMIDAVRSGQRTLAYMAESLQIAEAHIAQGTAMAPFTCAEMAEVVALVRAALWPQDDTLESQVRALQTPEALAVEVRTHAPAGADVWTEVLDHHRLGILTTHHAASSYGQPVVVVGGEVMDYAQIAGLHLLSASEADWERVHAALAPLGLRVTRQPGRESHLE